MPEMRLPDPFDGRPITKTSVSLRNAGDGLSKALAADAMVLHIGDELTVAMKVVVKGVGIDPLDDDNPATGPLGLSYVLKAGGRATILEDELVEAALEAQQKRNDAAAGKPQIEFPDAEAPPVLDADDDPSVPSPGMEPAPA
jgi:hypothetical protein